MIITNCKIKIFADDARLLAFAQIEIDHVFIIRDLKVINGQQRVLVAMPSRKIMDHCLRCNGRNAVQARYCNDCGSRLADNRVARHDDGRPKIYADVCHPITTVCREAIEAAIIDEYRRELELSKQPGYVCTYGETSAPAPAGG